MDEFVFPVDNFPQKLLLRVVSSDFRMGGTCPPPHRGEDRWGGTKVRWGGGLARDSRQSRELEKLGFEKLWTKYILSFFFNDDLPKRAAKFQKL